MTGEALDAHRLYVVDVRHPVEVPGDEKAHLQQWLTRRCGRTVQAPELEATGLKLVGGRLLPGPTGPASFLMYESASGERFTVYATKTAIEAAQMRYTTQDNAPVSPRLRALFMTRLNGRADSARWRGSGRSSPRPRAFSLGLQALEPTAEIAAGAARGRASARRTARKRRDPNSVTENLESGHHPVSISRQTFTKK